MRRFGRIRPMTQSPHDGASPFPETFLWGAATASHQVEGGNDGNDWWDWEQSSGRIRDGSVSGDAAGWWQGRAEDDLALAASLGQNAHRFSLEWSRIEPKPGKFDSAAIDRYREILGTAQELGLSTCVTLNHFTLPRWLAKRGSWLYSGTAERFSRYVSRAVGGLDDVVDLWVTLNEPNVLAYTAYMGPLWPPGKRSMLAGFRALRQMLKAHAKGYYAAREVTDKPVGIVLNTPLFEAHRPDHSHDRFARGFQDWAFNGVLIEALRDGLLRFPLTFFTRTEPRLANSFDFVGINYYGRFEVQFDLRAETPFGRHVQSPSIGTEQTSWGQVCPRGLTEQLKRVSRRLGKPVYVTENGLYDNKDKARLGFLVDHVHAVADALRQGVDVRGYFHWSLVDNFEWAEGWSTHFGLIEMDPQTGERRPRRSAEIYAQICRSNGEIPELE